MSEATPLHINYSFSLLLALSPVLSIVSVFQGSQHLKNQLSIGLNIIGLNIGLIMKPYETNHAKKRKASWKNLVSR